ncbi:hypothetical protein D9M69_599800 [compost metagenome]
MQRPEQEIAFSAIRVDDPEPRVRLTIRCSEHIPHFSDVDKLSAENEEVTCRDACISAEGARLPDARLEFALRLLKQRLEAVEILASLAVCDFLCRPYLGPGANMAQFGDIGWACRAFEFGEQLFIIHRFH